MITVSPLLPIEQPERFFERIAAVADAVVIDHFIAGDGTADGARTRITALPAAMAAVDPQSATLEYRDRMVALARTIMPGRVGVNIDGFAGRSCRNSPARTLDFQSLFPPPFFLDHPCAG